MDITIISKKEWDVKPDDYKLITNDQCYILKYYPGKGTCLIPVNVEGMRKLRT